MLRRALLQRRRLNQNVHIPNRNPGPQVRRQSRLGESNYQWVVAQQMVAQPTIAQRIGLHSVCQLLKRKMCLRWVAADLEPVL